MAINKNKIVEQAQRFTSKGQFEKAIAEYLKLVKAEPHDIRTWLKVGDLYTRMGARKEATETYLRVAEQYTKNGFHLKAIAVYKQILKLDPTLVEVFQYLAGSYLELGLTSEALIQLEQLADVYQRAGRTDQLYNVLLRMGEIDPHNLATRLRIAELLSKEDRVPEAITHFTLACEELKKQGRVDDFLKVAERLLYHDSSRTDLAREMAAAYIEREQYKHALSKLQTCFVKDPRDLKTLDLLAVAFRGLKQPDKAVSVYKEMTALLTERADEAGKRAVFEKILEIDPSNRTALEGLGRVSMQAPRPTSADDGLPSPGDFVSRTGPEEVAAQPAQDLSEEEIERRAQEIISETGVLLKYGLKERAADHLRKVFELDPYHIDAREQLKDVYLELGRTEDALEQLFLLADVFKESQPEGSIYYLHEILGIDPGNQRARKGIIQLGGVMPEHLEKGAKAPSRAPKEEPKLGRDGDDALLLDEEITKVRREPAPAQAEPARSLEEAFEPAISDIPYAPAPGGGGSIDLLVGDEPSADAGPRFRAEDLFPKEPEADIEEEFVEEELVEEELVEEELVEEELVAKPRAPAPVEQDRPLSDPSAWPAPAGASISAALVPAPAPAADEIAALVAAESKELEGAGISSEEEASEEDPAGLDIDEELEEIEFFLSQELLDEAAGLLEGLLARHPDDARIRDLRDRVAAQRGEGEAEAPAEVATDRSPAAAERTVDGVDLGDGFDMDEVTSDSGLIQVEEVFAQFKAEVKQKLDDTDFATHYDLGLAYREMGLYEDAIAEFKAASGDPARAALAKTMIGMCHVDVGRTDEALKTFAEGLRLQGVEVRQKLGLLYELGKTYQSMGKKQEALGCFQKIQRIEADFADVPARLAELSGGASQPPRRSVFP